MVRAWVWLAILATPVAVVGVLYYRYLGSQRVDSEALWQQAEQDFQAGRYDRVDLALQQLGRARTPTPLDRMLKAQLAMARNGPEEALNELAQVPDDHYMAARARLLAGQLELRRDRVRHAEELFRAALKIDPGLIQAHRELIYILGMQLRRAELNAQFQALSKFTDLKFENVFHWCLLRNNSWEPREVVEILNRYVAADPDDRASRVSLAENYRRLNLYDDVERTLAALPKDDSAAIAIRVQSALDRQDQEEADRLLALGGPDDPVLARLRGRLALSRRDTKSALKYFRIAYEDDPENRETVFGLLLALEMNGDDKAAVPIRELAQPRAAQHADEPGGRSGSSPEREAIARARRGLRGPAP